jgi:hypothetical protein
VLENYRIWIPKGPSLPLLSVEPSLFLRATAGMPGRFKGSFDYQFVRTMGCVAYDGAATGECYEIGSRIADENAESDSESWCVTAEGVEAP